VADIQSGSTILSSGFGLCGIAGMLLCPFKASGDFTCHSCLATCGERGQEQLIKKRKNRMIYSYMGA
jgi:3-oxoacid CoA-transferase